MKFKIKRSYYRFFSVLLSIVMIVISIPIMSINANAVDEDFSGIWLFNNVKHKTKFIHINDNNGTNQEGEIIELHNYNQYWALRWYIISVGNGYYKIESVISDKVLTAPTGYNNDIVRQTTYTGAYTQQWKFIEQSDGTYKISPRSNLNYYLAAGDLSSTADQDLEIRTVQSDGGDKWILGQTLPTSGYEVAYNEALWIGSSGCYYNCYAYAINNQVKPNGDMWHKQQPGEYAGRDLSKSDYTENGRIIINAVERDFLEYSSDNDNYYTFVEIDRYATCPAGTYKVALVVDPGEDYHWYRQDPDGIWSHKQGILPIKRTDDSGRLILDPQTANRGRYTAFVKYFAVSPWNNYYTSSRNTENIVPINRATAITADSLQQIKIGMTYEQVTEILGGPGRDIGSGAIIFEYDLETGSTVQIYFGRNNINDNTLYVTAINNSIISEVSK